jgi:hypothetical protein
MARRKTSARVDIVAKDEASKEVAKAQTSFQKFGSFLKIGFAAAAAAAGVAISKLAESFQRAAQAAGEQELALKRVETSLRAIGETAPGAVREFEDWASALQSTTTLGDETILTLSRLAISFTENADQARKLTETALDFAEGAGINYEEALRRLGRTLGGSAADVANFDDRIRDLTLDQLKNGEAIDLLSEKYQGFAQNAANTYIGALEQLKNAQSDTSEAIGQTATRNDELISVIKQRVDAENDLTRALQGGSTIGGKLLTLWNQLLLVMTKYETAVVDGAKGQNELTSAQVRGLEAMRKQTSELKNLNDEREKGTSVITDFIEAEEQAEIDSRKFERAILDAVAAVDEENESIRRAIEVEREIAELRGVTTDETEKATEQQEEYNESIVDGVDAAAAFIQGQERIQQSLRRTNEMLVTSTAEFDKLAQAQGRATAVQAALAGGGRLVQGGRVLEIAGGSRLVAGPNQNIGAGLSPFGGRRDGSYSNLEDPNQ